MGSPKPTFSRYSVSCADDHRGHHHPLQIPSQTQTSAPSCLHLLMPTQYPTSYTLCRGRGKKSLGRSLNGREHIRSWLKVLPFAHYMTWDEKGFACQLGFPHLPHGNNWGRPRARTNNPKKRVPWWRWTSGISAAAGQGPDSPMPIPSTIIPSSSQRFNRDPQRWTGVVAIISELQQEGNLRELCGGLMVHPPPQSEKSLSRDNWEVLVWRREHGLRTTVPTEMQEHKRRQLPKRKALGLPRTKQTPCGASF